ECRHRPQVSRSVPGSAQVKTEPEAGQSESAQLLLSSGPPPMTRNRRMTKPRRATRWLLHLHDGATQTRVLRQLMAACILPGWKARSSDSRGGAYPNRGQASRV